MRWGTAVGVAVGLAASGAPAAAVADTVTAATRAYGRIATFPLPLTFVGAHEREQQGRYLLEFVPERESVEDWTQMITLSAAEGLARQLPDPREMGSMIGAGFHESCPDSFWGSDEGPQRVAGAEAAHLVAFACGDAGGQSEMAVILVARSGADIYTLQWAARGPAEAGAPRPDPAAWNDRVAALLGLRLCPVVEGEEPPYPSCLD